MGAQASYGSWIRVRIVVVLLGIGLGLLVLGVSPLPVWVRVVAGVTGVVVLGLVLYLGYVYAQLAPWGGGYQERLWGLLLEHLDWDGRGRALDVGTGNGALAVRIAQRHPQARVTGIDLWSKAWEYGRDACERNARLEGVAERTVFERASAARLPFEDASFDAVVSHFVFHEVGELPDKIDAVREALRVLRPGGAFAFQDMFLDERVYGDPDRLLATIRGWGITRVERLDAARVLRIPRLMRTRRTLGCASLLYGRK